MSIKNNQPTHQGEGKFSPFDIWEKVDSRNTWGASMQRRVYSPGVN